MLVSKEHPQQTHLVLLLPLDALRRFRVLSLPRSLSPDSLVAPLSLERSLDLSSERSLRFVGEGALRDKGSCERTPCSRATLKQKDHPREKGSKGQRRGERADCSVTLAQSNPSIMQGSAKLPDGPCSGHPQSSTRKI